MPEMAVAFGAKDLDTITVGVDLPLNRAFNLIVEGRPAAVRVKFVFGAVQRRIALFASVVAADFKVISQWTRKRHLSTFVKQNLLFFRGEVFVVGHRDGSIVMCGLVLPVLDEQLQVENGLC